MLSKLFNRQKNRLDSYGVFYLHVQKDGEPFCILNIGNALCRVIGENGYGITVVPAEERFYAWCANEWDFSNLEQQQKPVRLCKQSEPTEEEEEENEKPTVYVTEQHGITIRLLVWRNGSYAVEFHGKENHCGIQWQKDPAFHNVNANLFGDPSVILEFAEKAIEAE
jgi:hypothetical protein